MLREDVYVQIKGRIMVFHSLGFFQITKEELISVVDEDGELNLEKVKKLYNERYSPIHYAG